MPKLTDYGRDIFYSMITVTIFATMGLLVFYFLRPYTNTYQDFAEYGWAYYIFTWVFNPNRRVAKNGIYLISCTTSQNANGRIINRSRLSI